MSQLGGAGSLCPRFSQNAWKKDLCSHCFKSKEEHSQEAKDSRSRYLSSLFSIRTPTTPEKPPQSILKNEKSKKSSRLKVKFPVEESKVIGYGGEEFSDDEDVFEFEPDPIPIETESTTEQIEDDKDLQRITKSNTDFNSISANLNDSADTKKPQMPLMLGQIDTNKGAQSPPLLVSIKPFGSSIETNINASRKSHLNKLLDDGSVTNSKTLENAQDINNAVLVDKNKESPKEELNIETSSDRIPVDASSEVISDDDKLSKTVDSTKTDNSSINILKSITNHMKISPVKEINNGHENGIRNEQISLSESEENKKKVIEGEDEKVNIKIALESTAPSNENRKTQITRGSVLTKNHEQVKTKRFQSTGITLKLDDVSSPNDRSDSTRLKETKENLNENLTKLSTNKNSSVSEVTVQQKNFKNISEDNRVLSESETIDPKEQTGFDYISAIATLKTELMMKKIDQVLSRPNSVIESDKIKIETRGCGVGGKEESQNQSNFVNGVGLTFKEIIEKERVLDEDKDVTLQVMKILDSEGLSREMAGEPDGRADSDDLNELPPALPLSPPPLTEPHPRTSFLHTFSKEKPKIPAKPKVPDLMSPIFNKDVVSISCEQKPTPSTPSFLDFNMDPNKGMKRQAPKPPPVSPTDTPTGLFQRNPSISTNPDSPVVKEREKRERANSCSPLPTPETSPRRSLSLSHDSLAGHIVEKQQYSPPEKICTKRGNKMRMTLRKILRLGSRDEDGMRIEDDHQPTALRPRPEIIHPLDLNKSAVQVLRGDGSSFTPQTKIDGSTAEPPSSPPRSHGFTLTGRPSKPPPPPRSQSLDMGVRGPLPVRPPPPKTVDLAKVTALAAQVSSDAVTCIDGVYANLGEARMEVMPEKPQRTGSIRDSTRNADSKSDEASAHFKDKSNNSSDLSSGDSDNVYESIVPECDLPPERSLSLTIPYCGSETESDIYYPYTFSSSEESPEDDNDGEGWRLNGSRKGRSIVHVSLEENYGAVIVANHEALSQLLEQANNRYPSIPSSLRALRNSSNLRLSDFKLEDTSTMETIGSRVFYGAQWGDCNITVCLNSAQTRLPLAMGIVAEFNDLVPLNLAKGSESASNLTQVLVSVLLRQSINQLMKYKWPSENGQVPLEVKKEAALVTVQLINSLKSLQARGIEEADPAEFVLCRDEKFNSLKICQLPYDLPDSKNKTNGKVSLCQCVLSALNSLPMSSVMSNLLTTLLKEEHATSLSQAKAVLEFWLWGPGDIPLTSDRQMSLQRWLDLERANVLQSLVVSLPSPPRFNSADHCHLSFLVHTSAKVMADASALFDLHRNETSGV